MKKDLLPTRLLYQYPNPKSAISHNSRTSDEFQIFLFFLQRKKKSNPKTTYIPWRQPPLLCTNPRPLSRRSPLAPGSAGCSAGARRIPGTGTPASRRRSPRRSSWACRATPGALPARTPARSSRPSLWTFPLIFITIAR